MWEAMLLPKTVDQNLATKYNAENQKTLDMLKVLDQAIILWEKIITELEAKK